MEAIFLCAALTLPQQPATPPARPAAAADSHGAKEGVYVLAKDYLAVCVHDTHRSPGSGAATAPTPGAPVTPAGGTASDPTRFTAASPEAKSYCTVILKRS